MLSGFLSALQLSYLIGSLTIQSYICQPPNAPVITSPVDNYSVEAGQAFTVTGEGDFQSAIILSNDSNDLVSVQADETNHFSANVTFAQEGTQSLSVKSYRTCGTTQGNSITIEVTPSTTPPVDPVDPVDPIDPTTPVNPTQPANPSPTRPSPTQPTIETPSQPVPQPDTSSDDQGTSKGLFLSIQNPANNSTTTESSVFINGSTNYPSKIIITVNGTVMAQTFMANSAFGLSVPLTEGENEVVIAASAEEGSASVKLAITRAAENQQTAWYQTEAGQMTVRVAAISVISILIIIVIIGIIIL